MSRSRTSHEHGRGLLFVMAAPSGAGKTTVAQRVLETLDDIAFSVSHTTRPPRHGEVDGLNYHFVDDKTFDEMVARDAFVEWAHVHDRRYGTSREEIERSRQAGRHVLLDVDVQGAALLLEAYPDAVSVFILPPSMAELERRLRGRGTDPESQITVRLVNARKEIAQSRIFRYLIVNDTVDVAVEDFLAIVRAEKLRYARCAEFVEQLQAQGAPQT